jgi:hypothetical protein
MKRVWALGVTLICTGLPVQSRSLETDAFGIFEPAAGPRERWAGFVETLAAGSASGHVRSSGPGKDIVLHLGEKSLVAGGAPGLVTALVLDAEGNLAVDGTVVTFVTGPDSTTNPTRRGIASHLFAPGVKAGQFHAGAGIRGHQSSQVDFVVHADAGSVALGLVPWSGSPALEEDFHDLATLPLTDRFGNRVADGTGIGLMLTHADGTVTLLDAVVEGGVGNARFLARDTDASAMATAQFGKASSDEMPFQMAAREPMGEVVIRADYLADIQATRLEVGPFLTTAGHVLNDGATVAIEVTTARGGKVVAETWVLDGVTVTTVPVGAADYPIHVAVTSALGLVAHAFSAPTTGELP